MFKFGFGQAGEFNDACRRLFEATEASCETCDAAVKDMAESGLASGVDSLKAGLSEVGGVASARQAADQLSLGPGRQAERLAGLGLATRTEGRRLSDSIVEAVVAGGLTAVATVLGGAFGGLFSGPGGLVAGAASGYGIGIGFTLGKKGVLGKKSLDGYSPMDRMKDGFYDMNMRNVTPVDWEIG